MNIADFNNQVQSVIDWNAVARNLQHSFDAKTLDSQTGYIHEEVKETIAALATNDTVETLDGVGDIFVTLSYKYFLMRGEFNGDYAPDENLTAEDLTEPALREDYLLHIASQILTNNLYATTVDDIKFTLDLLYFMCSVVEQWYGVDMHKVIESVMASNWSKFPIYDDKVDYQAMCHEIEFVRERENVAFSKVTVGGVERVSFRDAYGQGKIMKPATFVAPSFTGIL